MTFGSVFGRTFSPTFQPSSQAAAVGGIILYDTFTDTDNTLLSNHTADINTTGNGWTTMSGLADPPIISNAVNPVSASGSTIDIGSADCIVEAVNSGTYYANVNTARHHGLVLRYDGTDYIKVEYNRNTKTLRIYDVGLGTVLAESSDIGYNVLRTLKATLSGSSITAEVIVDGVSKATIQANSSNNLTATKHGIYASSNQIYVDDFSITV